MDVMEKLESLGKNSIELSIGFGEDGRYKKGGTRIGGPADLPEDFVWPTCEGEYYSETEKSVVENRPLSFLAQFNCEEMASFDTDHLLPDHGLLSFFYAKDYRGNTVDPKAKGSARVYWFEDISALSAAEYPAEMKDEFLTPMVPVEMGSVRTYPFQDDYVKVFPDVPDLFDDGEDLYEDFCDEFEEAWNDLMESESFNQLLGWPVVFQNTMFDCCELAAQGYSLSDAPSEIRQRAEDSAHERWQLLFQLEIGALEGGPILLLDDGWIGDGSVISFYIAKEDLAARRFDRVWMYVQIPY